MTDANPLFRPFPERHFGRALILGLARTGLFVFLGLLLFWPEGIRAIGNRFVTSLAYGALTFGVLVAYHWATTKALRIHRGGPRFTLAWWIFDSALQLLLVSVAVFVFYNLTVGWSAFDVVVLLYIAIPTVVVGLFPIAFSGVAVQLRAERRHQRRAEDLQRQLLHSVAPEQDYGHTLSDGEGVVHLRRGAGARVPSNSIAYAIRQGEEMRLTTREGDELTDRFGTEIADELGAAGLLPLSEATWVNPAYVTGVGADAQGMTVRLRDLPGVLRVS